MEDAKQKQYIKLTQTPVPKLLVELSIPTVISMLITSIYNMVDTAFVGRLGTSASGAVGVVFGFMAIIQALSFMYGQGAGSIMSRLQGRQDMEGGSRVGSAGFFAAVFTGFALMILGFIFIEPLVRVLGSTDTIAPYAKTYITYILIAAPAMMPTFVMNNLLRYEGRASLGMIGMLAGAILNMVGDPILMFVFHMGIAGAGLSTCLSQIVSFCLLLSFFLRGKTQCRLSLKNSDLTPGSLFNICTTGLPSLIRQLLASAATMVLNLEAAVYGDAAVAAMSIVSRVSLFIFSFALGIGQGFQPICGFNYGARKYARVREGFKCTVILAQTLVTVMAAVVFIFANRVVGLFIEDPEVIVIAIRALRLYCVCMLFTPFGMVVEMLFQSSGHKTGASILSSLRSGLFFIPILVILAAVRGLAGIQEAQPAAYVLSMIPSILMIIPFWRRMPDRDED